jgi:AcrR family transcriptional regulator
MQCIVYVKVLYGNALAAVAGSAPQEAKLDFSDKETLAERQQRKEADASAPAKKASRGGNGRRATKGGRRLSLGAITKTAIQIADSDGLDAVSIRRVAAELGARPMSLYGHISSKDDLLASMANEVIQEMLVQQPLPEDWREAIAAIARRMYAAFVRHPWVVLLFIRQARFGPNATKQAKQMARGLSSLRLEPSDVWLLQGTVNDYVLGHSLRAVAPPSAGELADAISDTDVVEFPELAALKGTLRSRASAERFELGLQTVLDGVERRFLGGDGDSSRPEA